MCDEVKEVVEDMKLINVKEVIKWFGVVVVGVEVVIGLWYFVCYFMVEGSGIVVVVVDYSGIVDGGVSVMVRWCFYIVYLSVEVNGEIWDFGFEFFFKRKFVVICWWVFLLKNVVFCFLFCFIYFIYYFIYLVVNILNVKFKYLDIFLWVFFGDVRVCVVFFWLISF